MKAALYKGYGLPLEIEEVPNPAPKEGEVLVKVASTGICHSDLHLLSGELVGPLPNGFIIGHEIAGWVEKIGENVKNPYGLKEGDPVLVSWIVPCGICRYCANGKENYCKDNAKRLVGLIGINGGHAEYLTVPEIAVIPLAKNLDPYYSSPIACAYGTAYNALKSANATSGKSVVIVGAGGVGSAAIQLANSIGLNPIIAVDIDENKLKSAKLLGATHIINANENDARAKVLEALEDGADIVYETKPYPDFKLSLEVVKSGGTIVVTGLGGFSTLAQIPVTLFVSRGITLIGSLGYRPRIDLPDLVSLASSGKIDIKKLVSHIYTPDRINEAYENLKKGLHIRAIIRWN
ncbi:Alcohol dehydrogenase GroES domain protein [Sulfolobus islandicus L.S.2.15]|uniref:Alcohol dehydrogenase GroES domain protein n=2 Tax=Saccharolobus islandicus TaxID=43080 RepID=C3MKU8_SACI2|nr:alcohol dehydrogenase catalytic domain-containing protein [Sulfolobus islandicus]ACP34473.1 Alcohol dehydrogenase GroES domain protein [Sulfolobus islandicus L.S.2.15]ADB86095.1 Alcohol dehydrogenase GroES domain protein [Sulfolobus islandicus L.D.8.5]